jgi:hypothetical protein
VVPCETPGAWQLPLLFGALPSWERALEKEWSNPSFDHLQLEKKQKKKKRSPSLACHGSTQNYPLTVFDLSHIINNNRHLFIGQKQEPETGGGSRFWF